MASSIKPFDLQKTQTFPGWMGGFTPMLKQLGYTGPVSREISMGGGVDESGRELTGEGLAPEAMTWLQDQGYTINDIYDSKSKSRFLQAVGQDGQPVGQWKYQSRGLTPLQAAAAVWGLGYGVGNLASGLGATSAAPSATGHGAWLGEGIASGIPAWDAAATTAGMNLSGTAGAGSLLDAASGVGTLPADPFGGAAVPAIAPETLSTAGLEPLSVTPFVKGSELIGPGSSLERIMSGVGKAITKSPVNLLSKLAGIYQGNQVQESNKRLYNQLLGDSGPNSAYAQALRQELERRDSASGRRSQYGPREVELQAKLAEQRGRNATTLAALMSGSNAGLNQQLMSGIFWAKELGLDEAIKDILKDVSDPDFWKGLFGD